MTNSNLLKKLVISIFLFFSLGIFAADTVTTARKTNVLLFHGGRPWAAQNIKNMLHESGFNIRCVDSAGLNGLGGAPIRKSLGSKIEPLPEDKITPEFKKLNEYNVIIVSGIPAKFQKEFFTPERVNVLRNYIEQGGALIVTEYVPYQQLEAFLPIVFSSKGSISRENITYCRSVPGIFQNMPGEWPCFTVNNSLFTLKSGATVLAWELDKDGQNIVPYIVSWQLGKGKVIYNNFDWGRKTGFRQIPNWCYYRNFLAQLIAYAAGVKDVNVCKESEFREQEQPHQDISNLCLKLETPSFSETERFAPVQVEENGNILWIKFDNGSVIEFDKSAISYDGFMPGLSMPVYHHCQPPDFTETMELKDNFKNSEYSTAGEVNKNGTLKLNYCFSGWEKTESGGIVIKLKDVSRQVSLYWIFTPKDLNVSGRTYKGFGEKIKINIPGHILMSATFSNSVRMGQSINDHISCRFFAYGSPRGYLETAFAEEKQSTTSRASFFSAGQPFNWLFSNQGVICEFLEAPFSNLSELYHKKGESSIEIRNILKFGRLKTPLETPFVWRLFSPVRPVGKNAWMAMYQYLRLKYCRQVGIDPAMTMPKPQASYSNTCTEQEIEKSFAAARKLGFTRIYIPFCPSEIESMLGEKAVSLYKLAAKYNLEPEIWTPASHVRDIEGTAAEKHPDWLVYDKDGKPFGYGGGQFKVYDMNNKECFKNYLDILDKGIEKGVRHVWFDMGAALMDVPVNYKTETSKVMLDRVIEIYKHLNQKGVSARIEGISPFAIDGFWYRKSMYPDHTGKEFAFVGTGCYTDMKDHLAMDYFRRGMYNAFFDFSTSPYACGIESVPGEMALAEEVGSLNKMFNKAIETVGIPFVQQTCFGTSWMSDKGGALFFWHPVKELCLELPDGWKVSEIFTLNNDSLAGISKNNILRNMPHKSVAIIKKND